MKKQTTLPFRIKPISMGRPKINIEDKEALEKVFAEEPAQISSAKRQV